MLLPLAYCSVILISKWVKKDDKLIVKSQVVLTWVIKETTDQQLVMVCLWMFMIVNGSMMFQYVPNIVSFQGFPNETQGMCSTRLYVDHQVVAARVHPSKAGCTAAAHWNAGARGNSRNKKGLISGE